MDKNAIVSSPVLISAKDFSLQEDGPVYLECDCACPDDGFHFSISSNQSGPYLKHPKLHQDRLPDEHILLFNPVHNEGVVVLNKLLAGLWHQFECSVSPLNVQADFDSEIWINRMVHAGILEPVDSQVKLSRRGPKTLSAWVHVTNQCNLRCDYCYLAKTAEAMKEETGYASIDAVIRSAVQGQFKNVKIKFSGGEATLNLPLVLRLDAYARRKAVSAGLTYEPVVLSNGIAIREDTINAFLDQNIRLMISLDGIGEIHDRHRKFANGKGSFARVERTLNKLATHRLEPFISITVTDQNIDGLPAVVDYVLDRALPFNINFFRDNDCVLHGSDLHLRDDHVIDSLQRAFAVIESKLPTHSLLGMLVDRSSFNQAHEKTCGVGESYMVIDQRGRVAKCHMEIEKPVTDVYAEDPLAFIRADMLGIRNLPVSEKEGCRTCEWKYWCTGGCPLLTYKATGRYDVKSPYCRIYKAIYPQLLRLEGLRLMKLAYETTHDPGKILC